MSIIYWYYHTKYNSDSALRFSKLQWIIEQKLSVVIMTSLPVRSIQNLVISSSHQILMLCSTVEENRKTIFEYIYSAKSLPDPEVVRRSYVPRKNLRFSLFIITAILGTAVAEWLSAWLVEQEVRGSIPGLATWIFRDWFSLASKSRYGWNTAGNIYFHFKFFAPSPFGTGQLSPGTVNEIKHDL